jgi:hypothetical protein
MPTRITLPHCAQISGWKGEAIKDSRVSTMSTSGMQRRLQSATRRLDVFPCSATCFLESRNTFEPLMMSIDFEFPGVGESKWATGRRSESDRKMAGYFVDYCEKWLQVGLPAAASERRDVSS